jgi:hypothetical protein
MPTTAARKRDERHDLSEDLPGVAGSHAAEMFARIRELSVDRQAELSEIIENMLDEDEDRRDIEARRKLVQRARALQDAEL